MARVRQQANADDPADNRVRQDGTGLHEALSRRPDCPPENCQLRVELHSHVQILRPEQLERAVWRPVNANGRTDDFR